MDENADPLNAYQGDDRRLRDAIENLVFQCAIAAQARTYHPGTLHTANAIMALIRPPVAQDAG